MTQKLCSGCGDQLIDCLKTFELIAYDGNQILYEKIYRNLNDGIQYILDHFANCNHVRVYQGCNMDNLIYELHL
jgi:hypothetical protein